MPFRSQVDIAAIVATTGIVLLMMGAAQVAPVLPALATGGPALPLAAGAAGVLAVGGALALLRRHARTYRRAESLAIVVLAWAGAAVAGAVPYVVTGAAGPLDALFESLSGLTTTGASIFDDVDALRIGSGQPAAGGSPLALHVWRNLTHWIGGAGVVLVVFVLTPFLPDAEGLRRTQRAEASFLTVRYRGSTRATLGGLLTVYVGLTLAQTAALGLCGLSLLDALLHSFATVATGGFSTHTASLATWGPTVQLVTVLFMVLGALNFVVLGRAYAELKLMVASIGARRGRLLAWLAGVAMAAPVFGRAIWRDVETRVYVGLVLVTSGVMTLVLLGWGAPPYAGSGGVAEAALDGVFNVATVSTTTGFGTRDFTQWPPLAQALLIGLMLVGGCRGSTAGGIKMRRILILLLSVRREVLHAEHPRAVIPLRLGDEVLSDEQVREALVYVAAYLGLLCLIALLVTATGSDLLTAGSATASCFASTGPGLGQAGPASNYQVFPPAAKALLMAAMLLGRLELYPVLTTLRPAFWLRRTRAPRPVR